MGNIVTQQWEVNVTLTRKEIIALGTLSDYIGNIAGDLKKGFPLGMRDLDVDAVVSAFQEFKKIYYLDKKMYQEMHQLLQKIHKEEN